MLCLKNHSINEKIIDRRECHFTHLIINVFTNTGKSTQVKLDLSVITNICPKTRVLSTEGEAWKRT